MRPQNAIAFVDTEIDPESGRVFDLGGIKEDGNTFHSGSAAGFVPVRAAVNYIVYWRKEDSEKEIRIILPELYLKKPGTDRVQGGAIRSVSHHS